MSLAARLAAFAGRARQGIRWLAGGLARLRSGRHAARTAAALAGLVAGGLVVIGTGSIWYGTVRDRTFDAMTGALASIPAEAEPVVVDIDRRTLAEWGGPGLLREGLGRLIESIAAHAPLAVGLDILLDATGDASPSELARRLVARNSDPDVARLAHRIPDGTAELAAAMARTRVVLGLGLNPDPDPRRFELQTAPVLARGPVAMPDLWQAPGVVSPPDELAEKAAGLGVLVLSAETDGNVRRVPLLTVGDGRLLPGLAIELIRLAEGASAIVLAPSPAQLAVGRATFPLEADAMLRLVPDDPERIGRRTLPAHAIGEAAAKSMQGRIVLVGSSAPELGGLRSAHDGSLTPSVQLHANAVAQMRAGVAPRRPPQLVAAETAAGTAAMLAATLAALVLSPLAGVTVVAALACLWVAAAVAAYAGAQLLLDPALGPVAALASFGTTALVVAGETWRRQIALVRRFEQHLAPDVVRRIVREPALLKLEGEQRFITALFTDVEGFTSMTERAAPAELVAALDRYFEGMAQIVVEHGGMVDKIVGDAVHALFNAPVDLADHAQKALAAALAIEAFSREFRLTAEAAAIGFGRTRVGIETGQAIVGDVGGGRKLDYTAHGNAVNAAARFEAANKDLGTTICIGPGTAALLPAGSVRPLGVIPVRGRSLGQPVFEPWPATYSDAEREAYGKALAGAETDPAAALEALLALSRQQPADLALQRLIERLAAGTAPTPGQAA